VAFELDEIVPSPASNAQPKRYKFGDIPLLIRLEKVTDTLRMY
jgi:hypothetical protein